MPQVLPLWWDSISFECFKYSFYTKDWGFVVSIWLLLLLLLSHFISYLLGKGLFCSAVSSSSTVVAPQSRTGFTHLGCVIPPRKSREAHVARSIHFYDLWLRCLLLNVSNRGPEGQFLHIHHIFSAHSHHHISLAGEAHIPTLDPGFPRWQKWL